LNQVLIVDDEADIRASLEAILREEDYATMSAGTAAEALDLIRDADFQAILLDIWLPDSDGLDLLAKIREDRSRASVPEVIMISGHGTIEAAVRATKLGAYDFLEKPLSLDRTLLVLRNAIQAHKLREDNQEFARQLTSRSSVTGDSVPMKALRQQIKLMAPTNGRVLIYGESGTGAPSLSSTALPFRKTLSRASSLDTGTALAPVARTNPQRSVAPSSAQMAARSSSMKSAT